MAKTALLSTIALKENGPWNIYSWDPSLEEIDESIEMAIDYLAKSEPKISSKINAYHLQVLGYEEEGEKRLHLNFYCDKKQSLSYVMAFDGGDCYFRMNIDLKTKNILNFSVNGEA